MSNQHLSEPLNKYLIDLVNREANAEWAKSEQIAIPRVVERKVEPLTAGIYNLVRQMLP